MFTLNIEKGVKMYSITKIWQTTGSFKACNSCIILGLISTTFFQELQGNLSALGDGVVDSGLPFF